MGPLGPPGREGPWGALGDNGERGPKGEKGFVGLRVRKAAVASTQSICSLFFLHQINKVFRLTTNYQPVLCAGRTKRLFDVTLRWCLSPLTGWTRLDGWTGTCRSDGATGGLVYILSCHPTIRITSSNLFWSVLISCSCFEWNNNVLYFLECVLVLISGKRRPPGTSRTGWTSGTKGRNCFSLSSALNMLHSVPGFVHAVKLLFCFFPEKIITHATVYNGSTFRMISHFGRQVQSVLALSNDHLAALLL